MSDVVFVDTETTGLDPDRHEIWEVAAVSSKGEWVWQLPVDLGRADGKALDIGQFYARRYADGGLTSLSRFSEQFAHITRGCHLAGAVISFDEERLRKLLRANGACPEWHYHLVDVEALAVGNIAGLWTDKAWQWNAVEPPWNSEQLSRIVGVEPNQFDRHTALGDALWAKAIYEKVLRIPLSAPKPEREKSSE